MDKEIFDMNDIDIAWCPGCGNFNILETLKQALSELEIPPEKMVVVSGIGQAAKTPHYLKTHFFNGLHGRAIPPATAIKVVNPGLTVIVEGGDGDMYGEGGNHLVHAIRRNPDITVIVHNNMVYGLTKGQASPTSQPGFKTPVQVKGVILEPENPIALAIALDASFVARAFSGDADETKYILKKAISHRGFSLVDIFQPCVSFNKINTYAWFKENTQYLEESYDPEDRSHAFTLALETEKFLLGIFYLNPNKKIFEDSIGIYSKDKKPLWQRDDDRMKILSGLFDSKKE